MFCLRVVGQVVVTFVDVPFLPPVEEWDSGLLPYPVLLGAQVLIMALLAKVSLDFSRGRGFFLERRQVFARGVRSFGYVYLAAMVLRYVLRMSLQPDERWLGGTIPIFFHWVLAAYVISFAHFHRRRLAGEA